MTSPEEALAIINIQTIQQINITRHSEESNVDEVWQNRT